MPDFTRRSFLIGAGSLTAVTIVVNCLPFGKGWKTSSLNEPMGWMAGPGRARFRYEGIAKVTGAKIYGCDFRARDMAGWPKASWHVAILKANQVDRTILRVNLDSLPVEARPVKIVTAKDLKKAAIISPPFFERDLLAQFNQGADYFGQPVALLYFDSEAYLAALPHLQNTDTLISYGALTSPRTRQHYVEQTLVKYKEREQVLFSPAQDGDGAAAQARSKFYAKKIEQELKENNWQVFSRDFKTQSVDPMAMEPENGLCWYDATKQTIRLVLGTQSPYADAEHAAFLFSDKRCTTPVSAVELNACYPGGGFGGKDHSPFALFLAIAAVFAEGRPIRLANTRFDQFQFGLKRHAADISTTLAIDDQGKFCALKTNLDYDGGGRNNFSWVVPIVGADNAGSAYYFPKAIVHLLGRQTNGVPAGSMRGFGTLQAQFALESLIDEAANQLQQDAIELRLKNAHLSTQETIRGQKPHNTFQVAEILHMAKNHALWRTREAYKKKSTPERLLGVGFAMTMKSFGTTRDASLAEVSINPDGSIFLATNYIDMGNGSATTLSLSCAQFLGNNAAEIKLGASDRFKPLQLFSKFCTKQSELDALTQDPRFTPEVMMSAAASTGAYQHRHAVLQATDILFRQSVWPAAQALWGQRLRGRQIDVKNAQWQDTKLNYEGLPSLTLADIAKHLYSKAETVGAMVHAYYQAQWATATFDVANKPLNAPIDALAFKKAGQEYERQARRDALFPPVDNAWGREDIFTPCGALCALAIDLKNNKIDIEEMHTFLDCGPVIQQQIVEGQSEGAVAQGIGQALYEFFPTGAPKNDAPWNLHRYHVPLARQLPVNTQKLHFVKPKTKDESPKGMAEVVLNPIIPAVTNAIAHATGKRFTDLPVTMEKIKKALS